MSTVNTAEKLHIFFYNRPTSNKPLNLSKPLAPLPLVNQHLLQVLQESLKCLFDRICYHVKMCPFVYNAKIHLSFKAGEKLLGADMQGGDLHGGL